MEHANAKLGAGAAYAASAAYFIATVPRLPECVASSFGASGIAQAFMPRAVYAAWFGGLCLLLPLVLLLAFCWLPRRFPQHTNIPLREIWLAPENRAAFHARMDRAGLRLGGSAALSFAAIHALVLEANDRQPARLSQGAFLLVLGAFVAVTVGTALHVSFALRRPPARSA
ncbi:MAG TPA: hypothetical protein VFT98_06485 [Myxococcota bacterium]|nr:hypothetical protein [Myxococcota bacterium]